MYLIANTDSYFVIGCCCVGDIFQIIEILACNYSNNFYFGFKI